VALPGEYRPLLRPGLPLKLQLKGYPYSHENLSVSAIGDEIVGPGAVRRFLGTEIGDAFPIDGPSVLVYAELSPGGFTWEGRRRPFYDGMLGRADVAVQSYSCGRSADGPSTYGRSCCRSSSWCAGRPAPPPLRRRSSGSRCSSRRKRVR